MNALVLAAIQNAKQDHVAWFAQRVAAIADKLCLIEDLARLVVEYLPAGHIQHHLDTRLFLAAIGDQRKLATEILELTDTEPLLHQFVVGGFHFRHQSPLDNLAQYLGWDDRCNRQTCFTPAKCRCDDPLTRCVLSDLYDARCN